MSSFFRPGPSGQINPTRTFRLHFFRFALFLFHRRVHLNDRSPMTRRATVALKMRPGALLKCPMIRAYNLNLYFRRFIIDPAVIKLISMFDSRLFNKRRACKRLTRITIWTAARPSIDMFFGGGPKFTMFRAVYPNRKAFVDKIGFAISKTVAMYFAGQANKFSDAPFRWVVFSFASSGCATLGTPPPG